MIRSRSRNINTFDSQSLTDPKRFSQDSRMTSAPLSKDHSRATPGPERLCTTPPSTSRSRTHLVQARIDQMGDSSCPGQHHPEKPGCRVDGRRNPEGEAVSYCDRCSGRIYAVSGGVPPQGSDMGAQAITKRHLRHSCLRGGRLFDTARFGSKLKRRTAVSWAKAFEIGHSPRRR